MSECKKYLPLWGKFDVELNKNAESESEGVGVTSFLQLHCQAADINLCEHLQNAPQNIKYTSKMKTEI